MDKFTTRNLLQPMKYCSKNSWFSFDRNCALWNIEHMLVFALQSSSALYVRYSCATPTLAVTGDPWRLNHGLCDVGFSGVNLVTVTLLMRL